jgi:hypothetical protein
MRFQNMAKEGDGSIYFLLAFARMTIYNPPSIGGVLWFERGLDSSLRWNDNYKISRRVAPRNDRSLDSSQSLAINSLSLRSRPAPG